MIGFLLNENLATDAAIKEALDRFSLTPVDQVRTLRPPPSKEDALTRQVRAKSATKLDHLSLEGAEAMMRGHSVQIAANAPPEPNARQNRAWAILRCEQSQEAVDDWPTYHIGSRDGPR